MKKIKNKESKTAYVENGIANKEGSETENQSFSVDISPKKPRKSSHTVHIDNRSFLALLIRSFVSFMVISVLSVLLIFLLAIWAANTNKLDLGLRNITTYREVLENGHYSSIPIGRLCGNEGWLCIVDADGKYIYSSDGVERNYTLSELDCIQSYGSNEIITTRSFLIQTGEYHYLISRTFKDSDENEQYLVLDAQLRIISGSILTDKKQFTKSEFDLYTFNTSNDGNVMEKYLFYSGGKECYAVYFDTNNNENVTTYVFAIITAVGLIAMVVASLILYIRYINKHVQRPLKALGNAMTDFAQNRFRSTLKYRGTKEFEQLVESFNEMVNLLDASEKQRAALEQDRQRMLAGLSHDLKTPITIIQGFTKAIRDGLVGEEDKQKYLNLIISKSESMSALISELYEYSKVDHPDFKLNPENVDVAELTRTYLANRYDEFEIAGYTLEADIPEKRLFCKADKHQLTRVFDNLTNNFFKYTPKGTETG